MSEILPIRPHRPQSWNPFAVVSLYKVLELHAEDFCQAESLIGQFHEQSRHVRVSPGGINAICGELGVLMRHCEALGLATTLAQLERVKQSVMDASAFEPRNWANFVSSVMEVGSRLRDELEARKCYMVNPERNGYLSGNGFVASVADKFPDAISDMDEAARCFAFERPTACIFHLMRVTEYGVKAFADLIGIADHAPTWEPIIRKMDAELKADYKDRKFKGNQDFLANSSTHLHAVKVAWRNKTMHVEKINTMEHAKEIYNATAGFMRYLAENMPERKKGIVQSIMDKLGG